MHKEHDIIQKKKESKRRDAQKDWFKPTIERSPLNARNVDNLPIHEHLTVLDQKSKEKHRNKVESIESEKVEKMNFKVTNVKSQKLLHEMKIKSCEELFRVLLATVHFRESAASRSDDVDASESFAKLIISIQDEEEDEEKLDEKETKKDEDRGSKGKFESWRSEQLKADHCDPTLLDDCVRKVVEPLLLRLKGSSVPLELFCRVVMLELERVGLESLGVARAIRSRQRQSKAISRKIAASNASGFKSKGSSKRGKDATSRIVKMFHPSINKKSTELVMSRSKKRCTGDLLFVQLHAAQTHIDRKKDMARKKRLEEEDATCTFQPTLVARYKKKSSQRCLTREE